ncbi:hypothetical protein CsSME_00023810 [Camellia sinensis var. sinensis]
MCFCREATKYPNRPVAEACGFKVNLPSEPEGPKLTDWTKPSLDNIFTTNSSIPGWCNVNPTEAYPSKVPFKKECDCKCVCRSDFVRCMCCALVLINALAMDIAVVDFVK